MVESALRRFLEHPWRKWIVITGTLLLLLVVVWPLADDYFAQRDRIAQFETELASTQETVQRKELFRKRLAEKNIELKDLEARTLPESGMFDFRGDMAKTVRDSGCQVRTMKLGQVRTREWHQNDDPLLTKQEGKRGNKTPFELRTQQFSLSVTGDVTDARALLKNMSQANRLVHTDSLSIRPANGDPRLVELEMELLLFDLPRATQTSR